MLWFAEKSEVYNTANYFEALPFAGIIASLVYNWFKVDAFQTRMGSCVLSDVFQMLAGFY